MLNKALLTNVLSYLYDDSAIISRVCHYWNNLSDGLESYQMKNEFRLKKSRSIVKSEVAQLYALKSLREDREKKGGSSSSSSSSSDIILSASSSYDKADATNTSVTNATANNTTTTSSSSFTSTHNTGGLIMSSFQSSHSDGDSDISIDEDDSKYCDLFSFSSNHINNNNNNDDNKSMKVSKLNKGKQLQNKASTSKQNEVKTQGQKKSSSVTISYDDILPQIVISPTTTTTVTKKQKKTKITTNATTTTTAATTTATTTIANIINDNNKNDDIKNDVSVNVNIVDGNNDQHKDDVTHKTTTTTSTTMLATKNTDVGGNTSTASIHTSKAFTATSSTKSKTGSKDRTKLGMSICIDT